MSKSNADFSRLVSSKKYILTPADDATANRTQQKNDRSESEISDQKRAEKKRKRAERKKKYFDRKKAAKEKERAQKEEDEFNRQLKAKLSQSENKHYEDLPEEYRKLIGGDFEHTHMVKGLDLQLLRQTKQKIAKQQTEEIEIAYHDTKTTQATKDDNDGDISMIMDIQSDWAQNIHNAVMQYYNKDALPKQKQINPKFCNGMSYKFDLDSETSVPTEIMRSQTGCIYGLVLDDFNEFEDDNIDKEVCVGYTPSETIKAIEHALNRPRDAIKEDKCNTKKRTLEEMKEDVPQRAVATNTTMDDDFDIFDGVGRDYVCNPKQDSKRRRVSFMTPTMQKMNKKLSYFEGNNADINANSKVEQEAAAILKSSLTKARVEKKRMNIIPTAGKKGKNVKNKNKNAHSLRGKLLSSGFSEYDDDDDVEEMNSYNSDEEDHQSNKKKASAKADLQWKQMQEKFAKPTTSIKQRLNNPQKAPSLRKFFS